MVCGEVGFSFKNQKPTQTETIWVGLLLHINGRRADALLGTIGCHESIGYQ